MSITYGCGAGKGIRRKREIQRRKIHHGENKDGQEDMLARSSTRLCRVATFSKSNSQSTRFTHLQKVYRAWKPHCKPFSQFHTCSRIHVDFIILERHSIICSTVLFLLAQSSPSNIC
eukprot:c11144_g1_i1 orf=228-578(+)